MLIDDKISCISSKEYNYFFNKCNVIGVGLGYKIKNGFNTHIKCIKVFVTKKYKKVNYSNLIPPIYKGIKTDVVESGIITNYELVGRVRPVVGGYNIGPIDARTSGSMGCLVTDGYDNYILSNNHVLSYSNQLPIGSFISQPSVLEGGDPRKDVIGTLSKYVPLKFMSFLKAPTNYVDCAIAKLRDKSFASSYIAFIGFPQGIIVPRLNMSVKKTGVVTEFTTGTITSITTTFILASRNNKKAIFKNQICTNAMAEPGDSGAVLLENNNYIVGLLAGGSNTFTIFNRINDVLNALKVRVVI